MKRLTYANVVATLALCLAMGSGAGYAANKIGSNDIKKNAVKSKHIKANAVKTSDLKDNAVTGAKVNEGTLGQVPSATNAAAVGGVKVTPLSVDMADDGAAVTLMQVGSTSIFMECPAPNVYLGVNLADPTNPPVFIDYSVGTGSQTDILGPVGPGGAGFFGGNQSLVATIRESSGKIHRLDVDAYYRANLFGGTDDCFAQGVIHEFG